MLFLLILQAKYIGRYNRYIIAGHLMSIHLHIKRETDV